jgi:hypothetical protein
MCNQLHCEEDNKYYHDILLSKPILEEILSPKQRKNKLIFINNPILIYYQPSPVY